MNAGNLVDMLKSEGAKKTSLVRGLLADGSVADIMMVEADDIDGTVYLKLEVNE